jgi:hypothetical protein
VRLRGHGMTKQSPALRYFFPIMMLAGLFPMALHAQGIPGSGRAKVAVDSLPVYSSNSQESAVVKTLPKGKNVRVKMEIIGAEGKWCLVSEEGQRESLGLVLCKNLEYLEKDPQPTRRKLKRELSAEAPADDVVAVTPGIPPKEITREKVKTSQSVSLGRFLQAVWKEDISAVEGMLENGADPNVQTMYGTRALLIAAKKREPEITNLLIDRGADVNARDRNGMTALMSAASMGRVQNARVLIAAGADIDARDHKGLTALTWAGIQGFAEMVEMLLENGADTDVRTKEGKTALWLAEEILADTEKSLAHTIPAHSKKSPFELRAKIRNYKEVVRLLRGAAES